MKYCRCDSILMRLWPYCEAIEKSKARKGHGMKNEKIDVNEASMLTDEQMAEIQASIDCIDWKQGFYDDALAGRTDYFSNLLPAES